MSTENKKSIVRRYNAEVIERGDMLALKEIVSPNFVNHSAAPGMPEGIDGLIWFFTEVLHGAITGVKVDVKEMLAEGDKIATCKEISGTHTAELMGIPASGQQVIIKVIDILSVKDGKITEHWGENNFFNVLQTLRNYERGS